LDFSFIYKLKILSEVSAGIEQNTLPNGKESTVNRALGWQHLSRLKASAFFSLQFILAVMKHSNLYLGLALPSGGCQSLIRRHNVVLLIVNEKNNKEMAKTIKSLKAWRGCFGR